MDSKCVLFFEANPSQPFNCKIIRLLPWQMPAIQATVQSNILVMKLCYVIFGTSIAK